MEELEHLDRRRRRADADRDRLVEAELLAQAGEHLCSALAAAAATSAGTSSPRCSRRTFSSAASKPRSTGSRCSSGSPASIASSPAFSFSQTRGTAKNQVGRACGRNWTISRGSGQMWISSPLTTGR